MLTNTATSCLKRKGWEKVITEILGSFSTNASWDKFRKSAAATAYKHNILENQHETTL